LPRARAAARAVVPAGAALSPLAQRGAAAPFRRRGRAGHARHAVRRAADRHGHARHRRRRGAHRTDARLVHAAARGHRLSRADGSHRAPGAASHGRSALRAAAPRSVARAPRSPAGISRCRIVADCAVTTESRVHFRLRLTKGEDIALGPGKVALLEAIARTGSITAAAKSLDMSYRRAWLLVDTMNRCFRTA